MATLNINNVTTAVTDRGSTHVAEHDVVCNLQAVQNLSPSGTISLVHKPVHFSSAMWAVANWAEMNQIELNRTAVTCLSLALSTPAVWNQLPPARHLRALKVHWMTGDIPICLQLESSQSVTVHIYWVHRLSHMTKS